MLWALLRLGSAPVTRCDRGQPIRDPGCLEMGEFAALWEAQLAVAGSNSQKMCSVIAEINYRSWTAV